MDSITKKKLKTGTAYKTQITKPDRAFNNNANSSMKKNKQINFNEIESSIRQQQSVARSAKGSNNYDGSSNKIVVSHNKNDKVAY